MINSATLMMIFLLFCPKVIDLSLVMRWQHHQRYQTLSDTEV